MVQESKIWTKKSKIWTKKSKMKKIPFFKGLNKVKFGLKKQNEKNLFFRGLEIRESKVCNNWNKMKNAFLGFYLDKKIRISVYI